MRRKILSFILALTLMAGMGSIAYAAEETMPSGSGKWYGMVGGDVQKRPSIGVRGEYKRAEFTPEYCVRITWDDDMTFKYSTVGERIWDPVNHQYNDGNVKYNWEKPQIVVELENRSNAPVKVKAEYITGKDTGGEEYEQYGLNINLDSKEVTLDSADGGINVKDKFTLTATPENMTPDFSNMPSQPNTKIGSLKLTFSAAPTENATEPTTEKPTVTTTAAQ